MKRHRELPFGAECVENGVRFRLWAPGVDAAELVIDGGETWRMNRAGQGFFELITDQARAGTRYRYRVADILVPDPASRYQPESVAGPSVVVDARAFDWQDRDWRGRPWHEAVVYELHVGCFSQAGTFDGVIAHFDHLLDIGINAIELMPVAECPGRWNWGYDGVLLFAVEERYGGPDGLKRLVQAAHRRGISVILDVVYNHFGPDGNYLSLYAPDFFTSRHQTPWGAAINFDDARSDIVRSFFIENALYWLQEYHLDGLRFDAVHAIRDDSRPDIVVELGQRIRETIRERPIHLILENDQNRSSVIGQAYQGPGPHTAQWNDDFHHVLRVSITDMRGGYYDDYTLGEGQPQQYVARVLAEGFAYQGEASKHRDNTTRGEPSAALPPTAFVSFIQNHDQVGNHAFGWRLGKFAKPEAIRAGTAVLLLAPQIPMLWMGQEWNSEQPFPFFCDFGGELADAVRKGRIEEFKSFPEFQDPEAIKRIPDPLAETTFQSAVLDWSEPARKAQWTKLHRDMLAVRREHVVPRMATSRGGSGTSAVDEQGAIYVHWRFGDGAVLQLVANLSDSSVAVDAGKVLGRRVYATADLDGGDLPPWYVALNVVDRQGALA
ncbi:MAG: malto-oligosyltrehalose trehalohydrolase [Hydrocarboniphaga sp.]|uniref:malto-oligosyltrehalose trehalohydrolase n=1 Tax=Hydrocarboniphaga sp. TaxID=2033016 RepID=UPI00262361FA|nr:malto-oligosyltrehalose trehalohydrolase [Hydrocarboniphaga sp.]MDB5970697.1 malto-oligosyltrehalose trehalohydrolase [Hydrocarboniphaga sp.]